MTVEEWAEWKTRKPTIEYLKLLNKEIENIQYGIGHGNCLNTSSVDNTAIRYAKNNGVVDGLERAIELINELSQEGGK